MDVSINAKMTAQYTLCSAVNNRQRENHLSENASMTPADSSIRILASYPSLKMFIKDS